MQRHRRASGVHPLLNRINRETPARRELRLIVDNCATHKHPKFRAWLERRPCFHFHFTPTSASWLNAVEGFFATVTKRRIKRGSSGASPIYRPPSTESSTSTTKTRSRSSGPPIPRHH